MKDVDIADVRNFVLLGHTHSGKTTLADSFLHQLGLTQTMGQVDDGTSLLDTADEEKERNISLWSKPCAGIYRTSGGTSVAMVFTDTPGYDDFFGQALAGIRSADTALVVIDAGSGVQVGTQRAWRLCEELNLPRGIVITGLDKENTDFFTMLSEVQESFGAKCVPVVVPNSDLTQAYSVLASDDVPDDLQDRVEEAKQTIIEYAAETDDTLIEKYLGGEELAQEELADGLHLAVNNGTLVPVFSVAAKQEFGTTNVLEAIYRYFPSPEVHGTKDQDGNLVPVGVNDPFIGLIWKSVYDPYAGQLSFVRVYGGTVEADTEVFNATKGEKEKIGHLIRINGDKQEEVSEAHAGDIVAISKLKHSQISDTLTAVGSSTLLPPIVFPNPVVSHAVHSMKKGDEDKLITGLQRLAEDDPTIRVERNGETGDLLLQGMGDIQLDIALDRLKKRANVEIGLDVPKVPYRETITGAGDASYKHKKQSGGRGQYGEVYLRVEPMPNGEEEWFVNKVVGGSIPSNFIPAVQKGLVEGKEKGAIAGYPVQNVRITVYDGSYHEVDSSEVAFKIAAARAMRDAMLQAKPVLLEPIMELKVTVPDQFMGDVNGDVSHKRGRVLGMEADGTMQIITTEAPMAELSRYSSELRSMTGGRGTFEMKFCRYDIVPANISQKIVQQAEAGRAEAEA